MLAPTHVPPLRDAYRRAGLWRGETLAQAFAATVDRVPGRVAVVDGASRITFATLAADARGIAAGLAALGVARGDVVAVQLPNWHETITAYLAIATLGAVVAPV